MKIRYLTAALATAAHASANCIDTVTVHPNIPQQVSCIGGGVIDANGTYLNQSPLYKTDGTQVFSLFLCLQANSTYQVGNAADRPDGQHICFQNISISTDAHGKLSEYGLMAPAKGLAACTNVGNTTVQANATDNEIDFYLTVKAA